jgi:hypothetical protein
LINLVDLGGHQGVPQTGRVRFAGIVGEDAPDPRLHWREQARQMPVPVLGFVDQPHLEDWGAIGVSSGTRNGVLESCEVSISYTLWRHPDDRSDPTNLDDLDDLDEQQRRALEVDPPWPRPPWLLEQLRRMRYPMLWECVRTRWCREPSEHDSVRAVLVEHVNHVLANRFRQTRVIGGLPPFELDNPVNERCVETGVTVLVDGVVRDAIRVDTDPDVQGVGVDLGANNVLTVAIARDALPYVDMAFAVRPS